MSKRAKFDEKRLRVEQQRPKFVNNLIMFI